MKRSILIVVATAIVLGAGAFMFAGKDTADVDSTPGAGSEKSIAPFALLKNAQITVPDSDTVVTLKNGEAEFETDTGSASGGYVVLLDNLFAQWGEDGRTDLVTVMAVQSGGTGTFVYLVVFDVEGETFTKKSEAFLGDRIAVTRVGIGELVNDPSADYRVSVQTLVRKEGEPQAATPTVEKTRTFYVTNQQLKEVEVGRDDT